MSRAAEMRVRPLFSDYALEYPAFYKPVRVPATAHLRYSSESDYLMVRGASTRKPNGTTVIRPVAEKLVSLTEFRGADFSEGNAFISTLDDSTKSTGNASTWRWAATDHHISLVLRGLSDLFQFEESKDEEVSGEQMHLI